VFGHILGFATGRTVPIRRRRADSGEVGQIPAGAPVAKLSVGWLVAQSARKDDA
jgi:hypothetical protein